MSVAAESPVSLSFTGNLDEDGAPEPWKLHVWKGEPDFTLVCEGEAKNIENGNTRCQNSTPALHLKCDDCSYKFVYKHAFEVDEKFFLEWEWKAYSLPTGGDVRSKQTDDQALQIYVYFINGTALNYIWDSSAAVGQVVERVYSIPSWIRFIIQFFIDLPSDVDVRHVVLQSGDKLLNRWIREKRNIADDYRKYFGENIPLGEGVGIQINSQHTDSYAEGMFRRISVSTLSVPAQ